MKFRPPLSHAIRARLRKVVVTTCIFFITTFAAEGMDEDSNERFAAFRVVRTIPGEPGQPEIILPDGYKPVRGERYHVRSRAEYYTFVHGPESKEGVPVTVRWPGESIHAVIASNRRLALTPEADDPFSVTFRLPVVAASPDSDQSTLQVWSHLDTGPGIRWRIEHNDPDRAAGPWTTVPWPAGQAQAAIQFLVAAEAILRDSGLADEAASRGHFFALMGFETNNTLHPDNPPHWHLSYYSGDTFRSPAYNPHFWINAEGRNFYNGVNITGFPRRAYRAGDPAEMRDGDGRLVATTTIREDGGLDVDPPEGPRYSIVAGTKGDFVFDLAVTRDAKSWLKIVARDDVRKGRLEVEVSDEQVPARSRTLTYTYDRLTGVLLNTQS